VLVIARSLLRMPVRANRRLVYALERLGAASVDATLDYLDETVREGQATQAAYEADVAAARAEQALRLHDAERLLAFAFRHDRRPERARRRGDLALACGRPADALSAYHDAEDGDHELQRLIARARAAAGEVEQAIELLERVLYDRASVDACQAAAMLDLARLRGAPAPASASDQPQARCPLLRRRALRVTAWARAGDSRSALAAARALVLTGAPAACAAELIDTVSLCRHAEIEVAGLDADARRAAAALASPIARMLLETFDIAQARRAFLHWDA
jgi:tetratricopeptide (TPR) repeat protein